MSFIDFIEKIQNKPRYIRVRILWVFVLVCSFFVVFFWVASLKYSVSDANLVGVKNEMERTKNQIVGDALQKANISVEKESPSIIQALKASIGVFFEDELEESVETEVESNVLKGGSEEVKPMKLPKSE